MGRRMRFSSARRSSVGPYVLLALLALLVVLVLVWDWNWFKPLVESKASAALDRKVTIGHLDVRLARNPTIVIDDIAIGNPPDFPHGSRFGTIGRLGVNFDGIDLLGGHIVALAIELDRPRGDLRPGPSGRPNWLFKTGGGGGKAPAIGAPAIGAPAIGGLAIRDGNFHVFDPKRNADFTITIETRPAPDGESRLVVAAQGTYAGQPVTGRLIGGSVLSLRDPNKPYPVDLEAANGPTRISLKGTVRRPLELAGADLRLDLQGADLADLYPLTSIPLAPTPPYHLTGRLDYADHKIRFRDFEGRVGSSDLSGWLTEDPGPDRPMVTADLTSQRVVLADLGGFIGTTPGKEGMPGETEKQKTERAQEKASPKLIPDRPINLPKLRATDLDIHYRGTRIEGTTAPLDNLVVHLTVRDGVLAMAPLNFGVGKGEIAARIKLDGRNAPVSLDADIDFRRLDFQRIMASTNAFQGAGTVGGHATLSTTGNSLSEMLGQGDGTLRLFMTGGDISALLVDLAGLDFGNSVLSALGLPQRTPLRCMVTDFALEHGVMNTRLFLIDTAEANVMGKGSVDLRQEKIDYRLSTVPKHFSVGSLAAPIDIDGPLKSPGIKPDPAAFGVRGGLAAALGVLLTPLGALLPTIQLGLGEDNDCNGLVASLQQTIKTDSQRGHVDRRLRAR